MESTTHGPVRWVASYPKSGNTWVRIFLMHYMMPSDEARAKWDLNKRPQGFWQDCEHEFWDNLMPEGCTMDDMEQHEVTLMRPAALVHMMRAQRQKQCPVVVKTHAANFPVDGLGEMSFPACFSGPSVYLYRDPRSVLPSFADHMGMTIDQALDKMTDEGYGINKPGAGSAPVFVSSWGSNVRSWTRKSVPFPVLHLSYESLRADPEGRFREVVAHLWPGKEPDEDRLAYALGATTLEEMRRQEDALDAAGTPYQARSDKHERFFRAGSVDGWRSELTEAQVARVEEAFGDVMAKLGYELVTREAPGG